MKVYKSQSQGEGDFAFTHGKFARISVISVKQDNGSSSERKGALQPEHPRSSSVKLSTKSMTVGASREQSVSQAHGLPGMRLPGTRSGPRRFTLIYRVLLVSTVVI